MGPFELISVAGRGGMGVVYRAEHRIDRVPVALKLLTGARLDPTGLEREIQTTAALAHPGVVAVYDSGTLPPGVLLDDVPPGAPYFAMEYLGGGSLGEAAGGLTWPGLRNAMMGVLDALAHAHARGVLHLDLKPANIMRDDAGTWRLVDFGISRLVAEDERVMGTPAFMAPEQLRGQTRHLGPWTDLYALGVTAWVLVTGSLPRDGSPRELLARALAGGLPPLRPRLEVPAALGGWLERLLEPSLDDRFACAADAAWALSQLPDPVGRAWEEEAAARHRISAATFTLEPVTSFVEVVEGSEPTSSGSAHGDVTPVPRRFRLAIRPPPPPSNLGLTLLTNRPLPFVGREAETDALWDDLRAVADTHRPRVSRIWGPRGVGKTRLAQEVIWRAHEVGAAEVLVFDEALESGLDEARARIQRARRPLVIFADEAGPRAETLIAELRAADRQAVWVLTTGETPAGSRDHAVELATLDEVALRNLLRSTIGVEPRTAAVAVSQTGGRPSDLVQLLAYWAARGRLVPGAFGYELAEADPGIDPGPLARLEEWLGTESDPAWSAVELAAVLGQTVPVDLWANACGAAGVQLTDDARDRGVRLGLLADVADRFAFAEAASHQAVLDRMDASTRALRSAVAVQVVPAGEHDRRARLFDAAGQVDAALEESWSAAMQANRDGDLHRANGLLGYRLALLERTGSDRAEWGRTMGWLSWCSYRMGRFDLAIEQGEQTRDLGLELGSDYLVGSGLQTLAAVAGAEVRPDAPALQRSAADAYTRAGRRFEAEQARVTALEFDRVRPDTLPELERLTATDDPRVQSFAAMRRAELLLRMREHGPALEAAASAVGRFEAEGRTDGIYSGLRVLGCVHIVRGDWVEAQAAFSRARTLLADDHSNLGRSHELIVGMVALHQGQWVDGARAVRRQAEFYSSTRWNELVLASQVGLLAVTAWDGDTSGFDAAARRTRTLVDHLYFVPYLTLESWCDLAAQTWTTQGDLERARVAGDLRALLDEAPR